MTIDLDKIPSSRRRKLIALGAQFGSADTLEQANQTLGAYQQHAALLKLSGFSDKHATELADARDGLVEAGVGREAAKGKKKVNGEAYIAAFGQATSARIQARAVLAGARDDLEAIEKLDAQQVVSVALRQTRAAPDKAEPLVQQLALLTQTLKHPDVATEAAQQGGPEALAQLEIAIPALRRADQEDVGVRGTPVETQALDLLDGIIVQHVRRARRAAMAAAKQLGNPALLEAFKLDKLYRSKGGAPAVEEEAPEDTEADTQEAETAGTGG